MKLKDHYDWVVLGDHPAALLSGNLMASLGFSVLILPTQSPFTSRLSRSGQCFDPESNLVPGLVRAASQGAGTGVLARCLGRVGIAVQNGPVFDLSPYAVAELIGTDFRFPVQRDLARLRTGLISEFGANDASVDAWMQRLSLSDQETFDYWKKTLTKPARIARPLVERFFRGTPYALGPASKKHDKVLRPDRFIGEHGSQFLATLLAQGVGLAPGKTMSARDWPSALAWLRSSGRVRGGLTAFRQFLFSNARTLGAMVPAEVVCRKIFIEKGRWVGIQVSQHGRIVSVGGGLLGEGLSEAYRLAHFSQAPTYRKLKPIPEPSAWIMTAAFSVHEEVLPPGASSRIIWSDGSAWPIEIETADPTEYRLGPSKERLIFARVQVPWSAHTLEPAFQRQLFSRLFTQLCQIFPFLEYHVVRVFPDFRKPLVPPPQSDDEVEYRGDASSEFQEAFPFRKLEDIPIQLRVYDGRGIGYRSGVKGLYVASKESAPELGFWGPYVGALRSCVAFARESGLMNEGLRADIWDF